MPRALDVLCAPLAFFQCSSDADGAVSNTGPHSMFRRIGVHIDMGKDIEISVSNK